MIKNQSFNIPKSNKANPLLTKSSTCFIYNKP